MAEILKCSGCGSYTMKEQHGCGGKGLPVGPAKWSPEDKYGKYRREAKRAEMEEKGLV